MCVFLFQLNATVNSRGEGSRLSQGLTLGAAGLVGVFDALAEPAIVAEAGYLPEAYMQVGQGMGWPSVWNMR